MLPLMQRPTPVLGLVARTYATAMKPRNRPMKRPLPETQQPEGPLRPHLNVQVNPNHGLYAFFRRRTNENSYRAPIEDGTPEYVALERPVEIASGRAWKSVELRRKSFRDLHILWYILLRERNLISTQKGEIRRFHLLTLSFLKERTRECRLSMARIKQHLTERSKAYMQAAYLRRQLRMKSASNNLVEETNTAPVRAPAAPNPLKRDVLEEPIFEPPAAKLQS